MNAPRKWERLPLGRNNSMCDATRAIIVVAGLVGMIGPALAADMTGAELKAFISDRTLYLETTAASNSGHAGHGCAATK
jgi:hypothetical protein